MERKKWLYFHHHFQEKERMTCWREICGREMDGKDEEDRRLTLRRCEDKSRRPPSAVMDYRRRHRHHHHHHWRLRPPLPPLPLPLRSLSTCSDSSYDRRAVGNISAGLRRPSTPSTTDAERGAEPRIGCFPPRWAANFLHLTDGRTAAAPFYFETSLIRGKIDAHPWKIREKPNKTSDRSGGCLKTELHSRAFILFSPAVPPLKVPFFIYLWYRHTTRRWCSFPLTLFLYKKKKAPLRWKHKPPFPSPRLFYLCGLFNNAK